MSPATLVHDDASGPRQRPAARKGSKKASPDASAQSLKEFRKKFVPPPPELLKKVRDAIPKHCFERNVFISLSYVVRDLIMASILFFLATKIDATAQISSVIPYIAWPAYWVSQGVVCTGLWVLAHECGHRAFSNYKWVDHTVGYIIHSALLVPFYSWKYTHSHHHKLTCHLTEDSVFVPHLRSEFNLPPPQNEDEGDDDHPLLESAPLMQLFSIFRMLVFGWPAYLIANVSGQSFDKWTSHFRPDAPIFTPQQFSTVVQSDVGVLITIAGLIYAGFEFGSLQVIKFYLVPYLFVNFWLVFITYLQHTDQKIPHYREKEFSFVRGALATVDRDYGILNWFFHNIADTHVVHHMFSNMPHYHAQEATLVAKQVLGEYYLFDETNIFVALWRSIEKCRFVEDEGDILWYKH